MTDIYSDGETGWRIEKIVHVKSCVASCSDTEDFKELDEALDEKYNQQVFAALPGLAAHRMGDCDGLLEFFYDFDDVNSIGIFVQIAAAHPKYVGKNSWTESWGFYQTNWVYVQTIAEAEILAVALRDMLHREALESYLAQPGVK